MKGTITTFKEVWRAFFWGALAYLFFWNIDESDQIFDRLCHDPHALLFTRVPWKEPPGMLRQHHFYAWAWGLFFLSLTRRLLVYAIRDMQRTRRARRSAVGQWYDRPDLTRDDLLGDAGQPESAAHDEPVNPSSGLRSSVGPASRRSNSIRDLLCPTRRMPMRNRSGCRCPIGRRARARRA